LLRAPHHGVEPDPLQPRNSLQPRHAPSDKRSMGSVEPEQHAVELRKAFGEFETLERRLGLDDSPLYRVLCVLIAQVEQHEEQLKKVAGQLESWSLRGEGSTAAPRKALKRDGTKDPERQHRERR
jgi:hypothetical protein